MPERREESRHVVDDTPVGRGYLQARIGEPGTLHVVSAKDDPPDLHPFPVLADAVDNNAHAARERLRKTPWRAVHARMIP